jgi:hypothetical protein
MTLSIPVDAAPGGDDGALAYLGGANLLTQTPGIRDWHPGTRLVLGSYAYARVRGGARATRARDGRDTGVASGATRRSLTSAPRRRCTCARPRRWPPRRRASAPRPRGSGRSRRCRAHACGPTRGVDAAGAPAEYAVCDCIVAPQGPNYALAKRLQAWRAMVAADEGHVVSANVAPPAGQRGAPPPTDARSAVQQLLLSAHQICMFVSGRSFVPAAAAHAVGEHAGSPAVVAALATILSNISLRILFSPLSGSDSRYTR